MFGMSSLLAPKRRSKVLLTVGALLLAVVALVFLSRTRRAEAETEARVVRIATGNTFVNGKRVFTSLQAVIVERDLFAELTRRNVRVEWVPISGAQTGPLINEGFANGTIDVAGYGDLPSIIANAEGVKTKLIVPTGRGSETYLLVPNDSTARSLADLKGKRIAIHRGRPWELPLSRLIDSLGLSYADFEILNLNTEAGASALAAKKVDALYTINAHLLVQKGAGKIIWSTDQAPADWKMRAELWASAAFVEKQPELTQIIANAYLRAAHYASLDENRDAMLEILSRNGTPKDVLEKEYGAGTEWKNRWSPLYDEPLFVHYRYAIDYSAKKKIIRNPVDFESMYDPRFVTNGLRELGLEGHWQPKVADLAQ